MYFSIAYETIKCLYCHTGPRLLRYHGGKRMVWLDIACENASLKASKDIASLRHFNSGFRLDDCEPVTDQFHIWLLKNVRWARNAMRDARISVGRVYFLVQNNTPPLLFDAFNQSFNQQVNKNNKIPMTAETTEL